MKNKLSKQKSITEISYSEQRSIFLLIWFLLLCQRLAISIGDFQISISLLGFLLVVIFLVLTKKIFISVKRLVLFILAITGIFFSSLISANISAFFSFSSLLLMIVLYLPTIFTFNNDWQTSALFYFRNAIFLFSLIGILQFVTQFIGIPFRDWLDFLPKEMIIKNFNYMIPLRYGSNIFRINGVFFAEPSLFSQFISLAIIIELYLYKKYWRLFFLLPALLFTFSGTGLILLLLSMFPLLYRRNWKQILIFIFFASLSLTIFKISGYSQYISSRFLEFQNPGTSGYIRFISPIIQYASFIKKSNILEIIFGLGSGASNRYLWSLRVEPNLYFKMLVEYGLFSIPFLFYLFVIFFSGNPFWLSFIIFIMFSILSGGSVLIPQIVVIFYFLLLLHKNSNLSTGKEKARAPES